MAFRKLASDAPPQEEKKVSTRQSSATLLNASVHGAEEYKNLSRKDSLFRTRLQINAGVLGLEFYVPPEAKEMYSRASCCGNHILHVTL